MPRWGGGRPPVWQRGSVAVFRGRCRAKLVDHRAATAGRHWQRAGRHRDWPRVALRRLCGLRCPGHLVWHRSARALHGDGMADRVRPKAAGRLGGPPSPRGGVQPSGPGAVGSGPVGYLSSERRAQAGVDRGGHADRHRAAGIADVRPLDPGLPESRLARCPAAVSRGRRPPHRRATFPRRWWPATACSLPPPMFWCC